MTEKINLAEKFALLTRPYEPGIVVPRGVEHCPDAHDEAEVLLIEPRDRSTPVMRGAR